MKDISHNPEIERALLGAILATPEIVWPMIERRGITEAAFHEPRHSTIFLAMRVMVEKGKVIDRIPLSDALKNQDNPPPDGWMAFFNTCLDSCPTWTHAEGYVDELLEQVQKRRLIELSTEIAEAISNGRPSAELIDNVIGELQAIQWPDETKIFESWRLSEIQSYIPDPSNVLAGDGWLRRGAGCLLTGGTGIGKSVLAQQIALAIASGVNILGCIHVKQPCRVLYVQAENDADTIKRDMESIIRSAKPKLCPVLIEASFRIAHVYGLSGVAFSDWLCRQFDKVKPDLLIIDPYQAFLGGESDINSTACFLSWIRPVNRIIQNAGCALLLVTHIPKPRERDGWTKRESVYMAAGSSAISNWARTSAELTQSGDDNGRFRLRFGKNCERTGIISKDGGIVRDLFIEHSGSVREPFWRVSDNQDEPTKSKFKDKITKCAIAHPAMSQRAIADQVGCSIGLVSKWYPRDIKNRP